MPIDTDVIISALRALSDKPDMPIPGGVCGEAASRIEAMQKDIAILSIYAARWMESYILLERVLKYTRSHLNTAFTTYFKPAPLTF